jgi:hypothetical protein
MFEDKIPNGILKTLNRRTDNKMGEGCGYGV